MTKAKSESAVQPQIIDLDVEDVVEDRSPASPPPETPNKSPLPQPPQNRRRWLALALLGGVALGALLYRNVLANYWPTNTMTTMAAQLETLTASAKSNRDQVTALDGAITTLKNEVAKTQADSIAASTAVADTTSSMAALTEKLTAAEAAIASTKSDIAAMQNTLATGLTSGDSATTNPAALVALSQRLDTLEKDVASLKQAPGTKTSDTAALSQSIADMKAKIAAGVAFQPELDRVARMVPAADGLDVLAKFAALGLPNAQGLSAELLALIPTLPKTTMPETAPADQSWTDYLLDALSGLITIRSLAAQDWPALAKKAAAYADAGDLEQAIKSLDIPDTIRPPALEQWRTRAFDRTTLENALNKTAEAVLREIAARG